VSAPKKKLPPRQGAPRARAGRSRQRQRLIDACISALHIYGPSRTTVEKVVAIAKMSPGIVRFYFDSKAAMLVASLQFLAAEFEERLLVPVAELKSSPVAALELMVDLYLDPDIASPRKVSVWYAFWGEASSRQEYYDICGQKDESFAALVRELIERLIIDASRPHLDPDGIALGLIGALEIMWQDFAFRTEGNIDRVAAKRRCMAYLRSVFPGQFRAAGNGSPRVAIAARPERLPGWTYDDAGIHALERAALFEPAWTVIGHESDIPRGGDFLTIDTGVERVLVVRDSSGALHALRNSCPASPHALVASRRGRFDAGIDCKLHGLKYSLDGRARPASAQEDLTALDVSSVSGLMCAKSPCVEGSADGARNPRRWFETEPPQGLMALGPPLEVPVAADWKAVVELWLEPLHLAPAPAEDSIVWDAAPLSDSAWGGRLYLRLTGCVPAVPWRRQFLAPNQLVELRQDGLSVIQAVPTAPGRCLVRRLDYSVLAPQDGARAVLYLARRLAPYARRTMLDVAESVQRGMIDFGYEIAAGGGNSPAVDWFRRRLAARIPALVRP
jgi:TetR/AcrR family transcriptional regulator, transcriptional repressor of bet genes